MSITLPRYDKRTAIIGSTGSGKTVGAVWLLSQKDLHKRPWFIFDFKGDSLIEELEYLGARVISVYCDPTKAPPGLYIVRPIPERDDLAVQEFLWKLWARGGCGIYVDEGYMLGARNPALNACLTQGRSKHIEMMILSQRPRWMSKFVFSEANYFMVYNLTLEEDRKYVGSYLGMKQTNLLPKHHSLYYDVDEQAGALLKPVPAPTALLEVFERKLSKRRKVI